MSHKQVGDWRLGALPYPPPYCMGRSNMPNLIDIVISSVLKLVAYLRSQKGGQSLDKGRGPLPVPPNLNKLLY